MKAAVPPRFGLAFVVALVAMLLVTLNGAGPVAAAQSARQTYTLIDLDFGGTSDGGAKAMNEQGQVLAMVGSLGHAAPAVWQVGVGWAFLASPDGLNPGLFSFRSDGRALNNQGAVVGSV